MCVRNDLLHILVAQSDHQSEEEISFRQSPRHLLLSWMVFQQHFILHRILIQIIDGEFLIAGHFFLPKEHFRLTLSLYDFTPLLYSAIGVSAFIKIATINFNFK